MSSHDFEAPEPRSSVKISCNAKGEAQPEVKIYEGADPVEIEGIRQLAVKVYNDTQRDVRVQTGGDK